MCQVLVTMLTTQVSSLEANLPFFKESSKGTKRSNASFVSYIMAGHIWLSIYHSIYKGVNLKKMHFICQFIEFMHKKSDLFLAGKI